MDFVIGQNMFEFVYTLHKSLFSPYSITVVLLHYIELFITTHFNITL